MRPLLLALALLTLSSAPSGVRAEPPRALDLRPPATPLPSTPWRFAERAAWNPYFRLMRCLDEAHEYAPPNPAVVVTRPARRGEAEMRRTVLARDDATLTEQARRCAHALIDQ